MGIRYCLFCRWLYRFKISVERRLGDISLVTPRAVSARGENTIDGKER
jgi:hypothetical protein